MNRSVIADSLTMHKSLAVLLILGLAAGLLIWGFQPEDDGFAPRGVAHDPGDGGDAPPRSGSRRVMATQVTGRCLDAGSLAPLDGVKIELIGSDGAKLVASTAPDGRFQVPYEPVLGVTHRLDISKSGRASLAGEITYGGLTDLGDLKMPRSGGTRLTVVDEQSRPVPSVDIQLARVGATVGDLGVAPPNHVELVSGEDGRCPIARLVPGQWRVSVHGGDLLLGPFHLTSDAASATNTNVVVRLPPAAESITGIVVDAGGSSVPGALVSAQTEAGELAGRATANSSGRFRITRDREAPVAQVLLQVGAAEGFDAHQSAQPISWGSKDLRVQLRRSPTITIHLCDSATGRPVAGASVAWSCESESFPIRRGLIQESRFTEGRATVALPRGRLQLVAVPVRGDHGPSRPVLITHVSEGADLRIGLDLRSALSITVTFPDGRPATDSLVELLQPPRSGQPVTGTTATESMYSFITRGVRGDLPISRDRARTDDMGSAVLRGVGRETFVVRVTGKSHLAAIRPGISTQRGKLEVQVQRGARLFGTVNPAEVLQQYEPARGSVAIVLRRPGFERRGTVTPTGSFEIPGLPAGEYAASFEASRGRIRTSLALAPVKLFVGDNRRIDPRIDSAAPGVVLGSIRIDGAGAASKQFALRRVGDTKDSMRGRTDKHGRFRVTRLRAGSYSLTLIQRVPKQAHPVRLLCTAPLVIRAGETLEQEFEINRGTLRLLIEDHLGRPIRSTDFILKNESIGCRIACRTDQRGRLQLEWIAAGEYEVALRRPHTDGGGPRWARRTQNLKTVGRVVIRSKGGRDTRLRLPRVY